MLIANPIYDGVFKYLLDDNSVAKLFLSLILDREIVELEFKPTEFRTKSDNTTRFITIFMIDFKAKIRNKDGSEEIVIIEIQKAKFHTDIMRFRKYLGSQYSDDKNIYPKINEFESPKALPIISIYFLGHKLQHTTAPVIKVNREYIDISTKEKISEREEFIECLTHDSYIIQIPFLKPKRQSELLQVLSVFDQSNIQNNKHILNIEEDELPEKYRGVIRRLQKAAAESDVQKIMEIEDSIIADMENTERKLAHIEKEKDKALEEKNKALEEKNKALEEKDKALEEKNKAMENFINILTSQGMTREEAIEKLKQ